MKYGQIAGNKHINAFIYHCFEHISEEDVQKFVKKFREQPQDSSEIMHTFRELILGAYLCSIGLRGRYDYSIDGKTPDWCIFDKDSSLCALVELTNFHLDLATESEIKEQLRSEMVASVWRDANKDNSERLYQAIWYKAGVYHHLVQEKRISYVVAVFGEFRAATDFGEVCLCLTDKESGLFNMYPELSGVLYFEACSRSYSFNYANNPSTLHPIALPSTDAFLFGAG
jgi:hypothetical protein